MNEEKKIEQDERKPNTRYFEYVAVILVETNYTYPPYPTPPHAPALWRK